MLRSNRRTRSSTYTHNHNHPTALVLQRARSTHTHTHTHIHPPIHIHPHALPTSRSYAMGTARNPYVTPAPAPPAAGSSHLRSTSCPLESARDRPWSTRASLCLCVWWCWCGWGGVALDHRASLFVCLCVCVVVWIALNHRASLLFVWWFNVDCVESSCLHTTTRPQQIQSQSPAPSRPALDIHQPPPAPNTNNPNPQPPGANLLLQKAPQRPQVLGRGAHGLGHGPPFFDGFEPRVFLLVVVVVVVVVALRFGCFCLWVRFGVMT